MPLITDITKQNLEQFGIGGLGFTMPATTTQWCSHTAADIAGIINYTEAELALEISSTDTWTAPLSALVNYTNASDKKIDVTLMRADGTVINEEGWFCTLFPQQYLRLKRLVAKNFEVDNAHNPKKMEGLAIRQVPKYYFIAKTALTHPVTTGLVHAGDSLDCNGKLQFFDENGYIIHPLLVVNILKELITKYTELNIDNTKPDQLTNLLALDDTATPGDSTTIRFIKSDGSPYDGSHVEGITPVNAGIGFYSLNNYTGTDTTIKGAITRATNTGNTGAFPAVTANQLLMGLVTYGRMAGSVSFASTGTVALHRDFFSIKVLTMGDYLTGTPNANYNGSKLEPKPAIRLHEQLKLLQNGNAVMEKINECFSGTLAESLFVAADIKPEFPLPPDDTHVGWPDFPALAAGLVADDGNFLTTLKQEITIASKAEFITGPLPQPYDVKLTLAGVPKGAALRVYNRVFGADAVITRGDGAGGTADSEAAVDAARPRSFNGQCELVLHNPLGILHPDGTTTVPHNPKLIFDLVITKRSGISKVLGALELPVQVPAVAAPVAVADNLAGMAAKRGVSNAAILGYDTHHLNSILAIANLQDAANFALQLTGETTPVRDAPRLPTMCRRDLLAAAKKTNWEAVLSAGPFTPAIHAAGSRVGSPGGLGGRETGYVGIATKNATLAYDIARMAFRRTNYFIARLEALANTLWDEPAANMPLAETDSATDTIGTFCGAVLQNIAPYCETPELALVKILVDSNIDSIPADFDALVDQVVNWINGLDLTGLPGPLSTAATSLRTTVTDRLNALKDNDPAHESKNERLYNELKRELSASCYGRRDSQWALQNAIGQAKKFIYIETPGFSFTQHTTATPVPDFSVDLLSTLSAQLSANPGLKLMIAVPKQPDYHPSYDQWIQGEVKERYEKILAMNELQVVCFHPVGFPGRPANIENHVVIIDDVWALVGSSAFRRRGLCFDGSADLVFTDLQIENGVAPAIREFRTMLLQSKLGMENLNAFDPKKTILQDGRQSFHLIREILVAGGLGTIQRLWNGHTDGFEYHAPTIDRDLINPDGVEFNSLAALVNAAFASLNL